MSYLTYGMHLYVI